MSTDVRVSLVSAKDSLNKKLGKIFNSKLSSSSCPTTCPFINSGCYGDNFPMSRHWRAVDTNGTDWDGYLQAVRELPVGSLWRHAVVGDFPHTDGKIDAFRFFDLVYAARHTRMIAFSHHMLDSYNARLFQIARESYGMVINASTESIEAAEAALDRGINAVVAVKHDHPTKAQKTAKGSNVVVCPATYRASTTCSSCGLCARDRVDARVIVAFPAHGSQYRKIELKLG